MHTEMIDLTTTTWSRGQADALAAQAYCNPIDHANVPPNISVAIAIPHNARDFRKELQRNVPMLLRRVFVALGL
jgi:hypothetical protein